MRARPSWRVHATRRRSSGPQRHYALEEGWLNRRSGRSFPTCHLCEGAIETLGEIGSTPPLHVRMVEIDSKEGRAILARYRSALSPAVVIDGRLFSSGRLPRRKLRRMLERMN